MCGRFTLYKADDGTLKKRYSLTKVPFKLRPRANIVPSQEIAVILDSSPDTLSLAQWGFVPRWAKDPAGIKPMVNARAETLADKPFFRDSARDRRCLIPADGFYEWKETPGGRIPYMIKFKDDRIFSFAGVWDIWEKEDHRLFTCAIITTEANGLVKAIHDRMPVILPQETEKQWLAEKDVKEAVKLLRPYDEKAMTAGVAVQIKKEEGE